MNVIDNAWKIPLSAGGIYRIVIGDSGLELYRIFSGKYIEGKLHLKKDINYIDSLIVPGATDPVEPADLYASIKHAVEVITDNYGIEAEDKVKSIQASKNPEEYMELKFADITDIKFQPGKDEKFPELIINNDRYILPSRNFTKLTDDEIKKYEEYDLMVRGLREKIGIK
jgi:hypothetical protein